MLEKLLNSADLPVRGAMSAIFILSGAGKIGAFAATQGYMEAYGLPGLLLAPTIVFEIGAGLALLLGLATRYAACLLAGFSLVTAIVFHAEFSDQIQQVMFLKNLAMAGGLILLARVGATGLSIDAVLARRVEA